MIVDSKIMYCCIYCGIPHHECDDAANCCGPTEEKCFYCDICDEWFYAYGREHELKDAVRSHFKYIHKENIIDEDITFNEV